MMREMDICEYLEKRDPNDVIVDIRDKSAFELGTVPGAVNIPMDNIRELYQLPMDRDIYVFCKVGDISAEIVEILTDAGYNACNLTGGYRKYLKKKLMEIDI